MLSMGSIIGALFGTSKNISGEAVRVRQQEAAHEIDRLMQQMRGGSGTGFTVSAPLMGAYDAPMSRLEEMTLNDFRLAVGSPAAVAVIPDAPFSTATTGNVAVSEPTTALLNAPDEEQRAFLADYQKLAHKIGYRCAEAETTLAESELVAFLHKQAMPVYDYAAVKAYLDATVAEMNAAKTAAYMDAIRGPILTMAARHAWAWIPLRACDLLVHTLSQPGSWGDVIGNSHPSSFPYTKPMPYPVLLTVEKLVDQFGERVRLEVSDIFTLVKADPFLAVSLRGSLHRFVIERWDEPKFRG